MADKTQVDYDQLYNFANQFTAEAEAYKALNKETNGKVDDLHNTGWIGRGSDTFFEEMSSEILPAMNRLAQALEEAGQITKRIADIYNNAEEESQSLFQGVAE